MLTSKEDISITIFFDNTITVLAILPYIKNMLRERNVEKDENLFYVVVNYYRGKNEWALNYLLNTPSNINAVLALEYCNLVKLY